MIPDFQYLTDGYKLDHRRQYPPGTQYVLSNLTARSSRIGGADVVPWVGIRPFCKQWFMDHANRTFFSQPRDQVIDGYKLFLNEYFGPNEIGAEHIGALHDYGKLPLQINALVEGTLVPYRVPMMTIQNTHPDFFWVTNYFETLMSSELWGACNSAATARRYRILLETYCRLTGGDPNFINLQGHDFSFRGMFGVGAASISSIGHQTSFYGTDCVPGIQLIKECYDTTGIIVGCSVPATEHSVMCAGGFLTELETYDRLLDLYPTGVVSIVSDTWNLWNVIDGILPKLYAKICARNGKLVIRPDSGDPVLILTGDVTKAPDSLAYKGVVEALWELFGGHTNDAGYRELNTHIGVIYGDSITEERARLICERLMAKGFASTNVVFGIGSYTYQYTTRDVNGFAIKATWCMVNGEERIMFKDPATDDGVKRSARGRLAVVENRESLRLIDGLNIQEEEDLLPHNMLRPLWREGSFIGDKPNFGGIRGRIAKR